MKRPVSPHPDPPLGGTGVRDPGRVAEPDRVWLSLERKFRVADYESLTVSLGASSSVEPGEDLAGGTRRVFAVLRREFGDVLDVMREDAGI